MLHSAQTANPRNSAKIDRPEVAAGDRPGRRTAHWPPSSGFQPSIQRPGRWVSGAAVEDGCGAGVGRRAVSPCGPPGGRVGARSTTTLGSGCFGRPARPVARADPFAHRLPRGPVRSGERAAPARARPGRSSRTGAPTCRPSGATCAGRQVDEHVAGGPHAHAGGAGLEVDDARGPAASPTDDHRAGRERHLGAPARRARRTARARRPVRPAPCRRRAGRRACRRRGSRPPAPR